MDQKEAIVSQIRAVLISTKGKSTLRQLDGDYYTLMGRRIPFAKLGYVSLEQFLSSIPTLAVSHGTNGEILVDAKSNAQTAHISSMVKKQRPGKRSRGPSKLRPSQVSNRNRRQPAATNQWRPRTQSRISPSQERSQVRPIIQSHNQFVTTPQSVRSNDGNKTKLSPIIKQEVKENKENIYGDKRQTNKDVDICEPYVSSKRRISELMSRIDVDRDSGNGSPTQDSLPVEASTPLFPRTNNPVEDLRNFAKSYGLGNVDISNHQIKQSRKIFQTCKIKISSHLFSSYPDQDFHDRGAAERYTAEKALRALIPKYTQQENIGVSTAEDVIERIPPMLAKHVNALWATQLEADYVDYYREKLPENWLHIIDSSQFVRIEKCEGGYILKYCKPGEKSTKQDNRKITNLSLDDVSVPYNTVDFNSQEQIEAIITVAISTGEVWCVQIKNACYSAFIELSENMNKYYEANKSNNSLKAVTINVNRCYVVEHEGYFVRVRVLAACADKPNCYNCFLIDYGDDIDVPMDEIYLIKREFANIQAQAFVCKLAGLDDLYEASRNSEALVTLLDKEVVIELANFVPYSEEVLAFPVVMYDPESGKSINQTLITLISLESATPYLEKTNINEVYISHIALNGDIYVQVHSSSFKHLQSLIEGIATIEKDANNSEFLAKDLTPVNSKDSVFLAKNKLNGNWCRAQIVDWSPIQKGLAQIYFIDYGNDYVIDVNTEVLFNLEKIDYVVHGYPEQAVKVRLSSQSQSQLDNKDFVELALKLIPLNVAILLRICDYDPANFIPLVELFNRAPDGNLVCINKTIDMESCLKKKRGEKSGPSVVNTFPLLKNVPSGGSLKKPALPSSNEFFNVKIPFAVNPWNFFVQPLESVPDLRKLMMEMQIRYKNVQQQPLDIEDVVPGNIYASKYEDGKWYRINVLKVIHTGSISVFFCDFGHYMNLKLPQLVRLDPDFMDLPYQAIKAKLLGIKPVQNNKWTVKDCELFKEMVLNKSFSSVIHDVEMDELYKSDIILNLTLIDTSTDQDIKIHERLVEKAIASFS